MFTSYSHGLSLHQAALGSSCHEEVIGWTMPQEGWIKLSSDGLMPNNQRASCGGLLRNSLGEFLGGFAANLRVCPITVVEARGVYYALLLAWNKGFRRIVLEMDSTSVIALIHREPNDRHPYASVLNSVRSLLKRDWVVRILHVYHKGNTAAERLADLGHSVHIEFFFFF